jgi:homoserine O-acetyltransferase/O-succinyltransferase
VPENFNIDELDLELGGRLQNADLAYETWGRLNPSGDNAILVCHGYTEGCHAGGEGGWWQGLIGSGCAMDTDKFFVVCSNMLGSARGSTGPKSISPETGKPYGPDFPDVTVGDMVNAQALLTEHLGIRELAAVVGYSFGGHLTFEWAMSRPEKVERIIPVASAPKGRGDAQVLVDLEKPFAARKGWNGGHFYGGEGEGEIRDAMVAFRIDMNRELGVADAFMEDLNDAAKVEQALDDEAQTWADQCDPNSLIALRKTAMRFDVTDKVAKITAPMLYILSRSDTLYPPDVAPPIVEKVNQATTFIIDSDDGHAAPETDWEKMADVLRDFLETEHG